MARVLSLETLAVRTTAEVDALTGAVALPLHFSTTFEHAADGALNHGFLYQRYANPTQTALETALAALDQGAHALHFASGLAAGSTLMQCLPAGGHVLLADDTYFAFRKIAQTFFARWGLTFDVVDMTDVASVKRALRADTCCLWIETPSNPLIKVTCVAALSEIARAQKALLVVDATFASPAALQPLTLGADVVLHSTTKYFGGHSDVMGGALIFSKPSLGFMEKALEQTAPAEHWLHTHVLEARKLLGGVASPFSSWMVLRGIRTLPLRVGKQSKTAGQLAKFLVAHSKVKTVHHPSLESHPGHAVAKREMTHFGGMLSFETLGTQDTAFEVIRRLKLFICATSLGGVESLIEHRRSIEGPTSTTPETLLRLSVGLENADDLQNDLAQALGP
jgi:cystathionine gamma-synthase